MLRTGLFLLLFLLLTNPGSSQEVILKTDFAVRDFEIKDQIVFYIEKRDIKSYNFKTKSNNTLVKKEGYFIGGYGIKLFSLYNEHKIVTASNELREDRSSIRFYDTNLKEVDKYEVLYSKGLVDFDLSSKDSLLFLSHRDSTLKIYRYGGRPLYRLTDSVPTNSHARKIKFYGNSLYYITDNGKLNVYDVILKQGKEICSIKDMPTNFIIDQIRDRIYLSTISGKILVIDTELNAIVDRLSLGDSIIEAMELYQENFLIVGDWDGRLSKVNLNNLEITLLGELEERIISIKTYQNKFYTSSAKKEIRKWTF